MAGTPGSAARMRPVRRPRLYGGDSPPPGGGGRSGGWRRGSGPGIPRAARPRILPRADGGPKLCAVRCARGEERGPGASFAPGDGLLGNQTVAIAFLLSVELKLKEGWESTGKNYWERLGRSVSREKC